MEMQRVVILGAGESGVGAAMLAQKQGFDVFVSDFGTIATRYKETLQQLNIAFEEKQHTAQLIVNATEVIKSPGIPDSVPIIKDLKKKGIPVISEIEFAKRYTSAKTICITGSNGKTTTTMLTYHILKKAGLNVGLAGNIGQSFAAQVATENFDWYVLEISSFMLDDMFAFRADVAVLLNITPDHLDRYDYKMANYAASKMRISQNQQADDVFIYCTDDEETLKAIKTTKIHATKYPFSIRKKVEEGAYLEGDNIHIKINPLDPLTMSISELALQGKHNIYKYLIYVIL
jgi:UDP-N-acetylmuramoylalanine--D-glutamate ligase